MLKALYCIGALCLWIYGIIQIMFFHSYNSYNNLKTSVDLSKAIKFDPGTTISNKIGARFTRFRCPLGGPQGPPLATPLFSWNLTGFDGT